jgi:hypothetical protein
MDQALFDAAFEVARPGFSAGMTPTQSGFETVLSQTSELSEQDLSGLTFDSVFDLSYLELATQ